MNRSLDISIHGVDRVNIIEKLVHVCRYSPGLVLLDGVAGKGPVNFLLHLSELLRDELDLVFLRSADKSTSHIYAAMIAHWYIYRRDDTHQADVQSIHHFLDVSSQAGKLSLIVVERASLIDDDAIDFLIFLMARHSQLTVLLAGVVDALPFLRRAQIAEVPVNWIELPDIKENTDNPNDNVVVNSVAYSHPCPVLSSNDFGEVSPEPPLLSDLDVFDESFFFTDSSVKSGFSAIDNSDELVDGIDRSRIASKAWIDSEILGFYSRNDSRPYWVFGALGCVFLLGFFLFKNQFDTSESAVRNSSGSFPPDTISSPVAYSPVVSIQSGNESAPDNAISTNKQVASAIPSASDSSASEGAVYASSDVATQQIGINDIRDDSVSESGRRKVREGEVIKVGRGRLPAASVNSQHLTSKSTVGKSVKDVRWSENYWRSNPDNYTVQIVSSHGNDAIKSIAEKLPLDQPHFIYRTIREGRPWHILIYGSFGSKVEADLAKTKLVARVDSGSSPWVRKQWEIFGR